MNLRHEVHKTQNQRLALLGLCLLIFVYVLYPQSQAMRPPTAGPANTGNQPQPWAQGAVAGDAPPEAQPIMHPPAFKSRFTSADLQRSITQAEIYLNANQRDEGNFNYEYDFSMRTMTEDDNEVRQIGALWGLVLSNKYNPSDETRAAIRKGITYFFESNSVLRSDGSRYVSYPGKKIIGTGTQALGVLSLVDYLSDKTLPDDERKLVRGYLDETLKFLLSLRQVSGTFYGKYVASDGQAMGVCNPYSDGEALLAMVKIAKQEQRQSLLPKIQSSAKAMFDLYVADTLAQGLDPATTKGFYQWSSMSFYHMYTAGWDFGRPYAHHTVDMALWMIDIHNTLKRSRNTGYAYEGLCVAYELARLLGREHEMLKIRSVIDQGLFKLMQWQVDGPFPNNYIKTNWSPTDTLATGGFMNEAHAAPLRIDVTQHMLHALLYAQAFVYGTPM